MDERIRRLERRAVRGDVEAFRRLLAEWVRSGCVARERAELAVHLGDLHAANVLGQTPPTPTTRLHLCRWVRRLRDWGDSTLVRGALALSHLTLSRFSAEIGGWRSEQATDAIRAAEEWLICPCTRHGLVAGTKAKRMLEGMRVHTGAELGFASVLACDVTYGRRLQIDRVVLNHRVWLPPLDVRDAIRAELLPWVCLGEDPVSERRRVTPKLRHEPTWRPTVEP